MAKKKLTATDKVKLLTTLQKRFEKNMNRHKGVEWNKVQAKLEKQEDKLWSLSEMESTGGEPDVILFGKELFFVDCSTETPAGRRSICYDGEARTSRKEHAPKNSAHEMAKAMGVEMLDEDQYRALQKLEKFDLKTSSWIKTPAEIRELGGGLYCERRYDQVFTGHNGVQSYYAVRGFRGLLRL